jgi:hypothetical protein
MLALGMQAETITAVAEGVLNVKDVQQSADGKWEGVVRLEAARKETDHASAPPIASMVPRVTVNAQLIPPYVANI